MKLQFIAASAFLLASTGAHAQDVNFADVDADGSGGLSLAEVQAVAPSATQEQFTAYDTDGSGELSEAEFAAWLSADGQ